MADESGLPQVPLAAGVVSLVLDESALDSAIERIAKRIEDRFREAVESAMDAATSRLSLITADGPQVPAPTPGPSLPAPSVQVQQTNQESAFAPEQRFDDRVPQALSEVLQRMLIIEAQIANVADALEIERNSL